MKIFIVLLPVFLFGMSLSDLIKDMDENPLLKSQDAKIKAMKHLVKEAKGKDRPKVDIEVSDIRLKETPMATFYIPNFPPFDVPVGTKDNITAAINFSYPIFSGYAIEANIKRSKLELIKQKLKKDDIKRNLYLKVVELYAGLFSINKAIDAAKMAKKAMNDSLKVAKGMYENELIGAEKLYNIEAKKYQVDAMLEELLSRKQIIKDSLFYLTQKKVDKAFLNIPNIKTDIRSLSKKALKNREDIKVIKQDLGILEEELKIVKSEYYPKVAVIGAVKRESDDFGLGSNGYTNPDKSYIGVGLKWDIYSGYSTTSKKEAIKAKKESTLFYLKDYENKVITNIKKSLWELKSYKALLKAANKEISAQKKYLKLTKAKFKNSLVSSDELSRAILSYYQAVAKKEDIRSKIFYTKYKIKLQTGLKNF